MGNFSDAIKAATSAVICSVLAGTEAASYFGSSLVLGGGNTDFADGVRQLRRWVCDNPDPQVDLPEPEFAGGQCPDRYIVSVTRSGQNVNCSSGAVGNIPNETRGLSSCTPGFDIYGPLTPVVRTNEGNCGTESLDIGVSGFTQGGAPLELTTRLGASNSNTRLENQQYTINVTPCPGNPDNCGSLPSPEVPPYSPVTITRSITYEDNSQTTINEDGDFIINAPVIIGGNIIAPVTVNLGGLEIPVEVNLSTGDISIEVGGGLDDSPAPIDDPNPVDNPTTDDPDLEDELLYGLIVYSTPTGSGRVASTIVGQDQAPTLLLPRTGNVWFQVPVGDRVSWLGPVPVQAENALVRVPWGMGASGYRLVPSSGWQMSAVRVGKPPCGCLSA